MGNAATRQGCHKRDFFDRDCVQEVCSIPVLVCCRAILNEI
ncbi:MAG: hypothetical protein RIS29_1740 [Bacteroidota bacterium]|jgi:hypothetical protein